MLTTSRHHCALNAAPCLLQLHVMLPEAMADSAGSIRTIVKDDSDADVQSFLDSDGYVVESIRYTQPADKANDGSWHMFTVTSTPDGTKGFQVFLDGQFAGERCLAQALRLRTIQGDLWGCTCAGGESIRASQDAPAQARTPAGCCAVPSASLHT